MENFKKVVRLGTMEGYTYSVYCEIEFTDGELSISGVEGPKRNGDASGSCGQIAMHLRADHIGELAPGWTTEKISRFLNIWNRWHLNKMRAGSPAQEQWLRENPIDAKYPKSYYDEACKALTIAGLQPDNGYSYGSAWCRETVPDEVLNELRGLPTTDKTPAWV